MASNSEGSIYFRPPSKMIGAKSDGFSISMCDDVLLEVLSSGNRKQLFTLTKNGKRFSRLVDGFFVRAPLLHIDIILWEDVRFNLHIYCLETTVHRMEVQNCANKSVVQIQTVNPRLPIYINLYSAINEHR